MTALGKRQAQPFSKAQVKELIENLNTFEPGTEEIRNVVWFAKKWDRIPSSVHSLVRSLQKDGAKINILKRGEYYKTMIADLRKTDPDLFHKIAKR